MQTSVITILGDVILDRYIHGSTTRISPEAPVPVVKVDNDYYTLGGAANVAHNLANLGATVKLLGAVGRDESGRWLHDLLVARDIEPVLYLDAQIPTTTKTRIVSRNQQMIRIDNEGHFSHSPRSLEYFKHHFDQAEVLVVSDYDKGFCSEDVMDWMFQNLKSGAKVLVDPKGKNWEKYNGAFLVKPNLAELEEVSGKKVMNEDKVIESIGAEVYQRYNFAHLLITRGKEGMTLINKEGVSHFPTHKVDVFDVSGAGDTAMAVLALKLQQGYPLGECIRYANLASAFVVTKPTTYAINTKELDDMERMYGDEMK